MPLTHEQKASVGLDYLDELKARIKTREEAQKRALNQSNEMGRNGDKLMKFATAAAKKHKIDSVMTSAAIDDDYENGRRIDYLKLSFQDGIFLRIPVSSVPGLQAEKDARKNVSDLSKTICQEIQFLHSMIAPTKISSFQAHVARLWSPKTKDSRITAGELRQFVEDFLMSARPAVCKVA